MDRKTKTETDEEYRHRFKAEQLSQWIINSVRFVFIAALILSHFSGRAYVSDGFIVGFMMYYLWKAVYYVVSNRRRPSVQLNNEIHETDILSLPDVIALYNMRGISNPDLLKPLLTRSLIQCQEARLVDWEAGVETNLVLILSRTASLQLSNRTQRVIDSFIAVAKGRASLEKNYTLNRLLVLAILKSLTQFGTECDQGSIKTLAAGRGLAFDSPEIKVAAIQCLTTIKSRKAEMERSLAARSNLLTDADSPVSTQTLLRPAGSGDQRDVDSLLLPASSTVKSDQIEDEYLLNG